MIGESIKMIGEESIINMIGEESINMIVGVEIGVVGDMIREHVDLLLDDLLP